jgi:hypothetical protein
MVFPSYLPERILLATITLSAAFSMRDLSGRLMRGAYLSYGIYIYHFSIINVLLKQPLRRSSLRYARPSRT